MATVDKMPMLAEGYEKLQADIGLNIEERPRSSTDRGRRGHGDLSENAEYHAAKERQGHVEMQIADIEDRLSRAQVIDPTTLSGDKVVFGATVHLLDENDKPVTYQIVGETEADAKIGRISYNSPLGRALIGRNVGDEVEFSAPSGDKYCETRISSSNKRVDGAQQSLRPACLAGVQDELREAIQTG